MTDTPQQDAWHQRMVQPLLPIYRRPIRPADLSSYLAAMMLSRRHTLEDVNYTRVSPNRFIVEVNQQIYERYFRLIQDQVIRQWTERLSARLKTANSRHGRKEFRLGGPLRIEIRPVPDLLPYQARILARIDAGHSAEQTAPLLTGACLELLPSGQRFPLQAGLTTLGRDESSSIPLRTPEVQQTRLVSGRHAHIRQQDGGYHLFDGSPEGRPSVNGTFVNGARLTGQGRLLHDGDTIILASTSPNTADPSIPGVVALRFHQDCS
jgi:hypothetical protein